MIHDFTKGLDESNWSLVTDGTPDIEEVKEGEFGEVGVSFSREESFVPHTIGPKQKTLGEVSCTRVAHTHTHSYAHTHMHTRTHTHRLAWWLSSYKMN